MFLRDDTKPLIGNPHGHGENTPNSTQTVRFRINSGLESLELWGRKVNMLAGKAHALRKLLQWFLHDPAWHLVICVGKVLYIYRTQHSSLPLARAFENKGPLRMRLYLSSNKIQLFGDNWCKDFIIEHWPSSNEEERCSFWPSTWISILYILY